MTPHPKSIEVVEVASGAPYLASKCPSKPRKTLKPTTGLKRASGLSKGKKTVSSKKKKKPPKPKVRTNLSLADELFSQRIIARDGKCLFPECKSNSRLTTSHYHGRGKFSTRFDEKNCICLCQYHHYMSRVLGWEFQKQRKEKHGWDGQYTLFMRNWLGDEEFAALDARAKRTTKQSKAILAFMETVENLSKEG